MAVDTLSTDGIQQRNKRGIAGSLGRAAWHSLSIRAGTPVARAFLEGQPAECRGPRSRPLPRCSGNPNKSTRGQGHDRQLARTAPTQGAQIRVLTLEPSRVLPSHLLSPRQPFNKNKTWLYPADRGPAALLFNLCNLPFWLFFWSLGLEGKQHSLPCLFGTRLGASAPPTIPRYES